MKLAAKYGLPVICLIDTPGAYPGIGAEERGQAQVIAQNMFEMSRLPTPGDLRRDRRRGLGRGAWESASATRSPCSNTPIIR